MIRDVGYGIMGSQLKVRSCVSGLWRFRSCRTACVIQYASQLEERIAKLSSAGRDLNVSQWFYLFSFDVMGEFAFGKSFNMLRNEE